MGKQKPAQADGRSADALVKQGGKSEKRLLRLERKAEHALTEARAKLQKAQVRLERRLSAVSDAEALLRTRQAARAAGPQGANGAPPELLPRAIDGAKRPDAELGSPVIVLDGEVPSDGQTTEPPASLILPPAAKPQTRRKSSRSGAPRK